ncbi:SOS response-associated peptidase family protein [Phenylobacterium sp.]|jgi:putative SOS response-associated peptidase YedK|uniref:SOS response-associated peptidase family protein n=1 Tax=Phenylobacterium sp. TaxID=1871053 RepID=UPI003783FC84
MCNAYRLRVPLSQIFDEFSDLKAPLTFSGGVPNVPPADDIRITDKAPVLRGGRAGVDVALTPWAWKAPNGAPVFNFRSDGRDFSRSERCLIPTDGFYEFTARLDGQKSPKHKHLFTLAGADWFWIAGLVKDGAFAMLTTAPGPDVAPWHGRQVVVLPPDRGLDWLDLSRPQSELLRPLPAGSLAHEQLN